MGILVVDDDDDVREAFQALLSSGGYTDVIPLESAESAFSFLALDAPLVPVAPLNLILLDIVMPNVDGYQTCARIRRDHRYANVPIVMTTSLDDDESVDRAFKVGATDYLTNPMKAVDLLACVRSMLILNAELDRRNALERELAQHVQFQF